MPPARYAWPAGLAAAGAAWYAADSLRHRREGGHGYDLHGEADAGGPAFLRATEALTGAPISHGNTVELLINGDRIFPAFLDTLRGAERTLCLLTYVYWQGDIAVEVAETLCERARAGVEVNVILDAVGGGEDGHDAGRGDGGRPACASCASARRSPTRCAG